MDRSEYLSKYSTCWEKMKRKGLHADTAIN